MKLIRMMLVPIMGVCAVLTGSAANVFSDASEWLAVKGASEKSIGQRVPDGMSWFARRFSNKKEVKRATWVVSGLGTFDVYVNGERLENGKDFLKPGYTHFEKTKYAFEYDVTRYLRKAANAENVLAAEVSRNWWGDKILVWGDSFRSRRAGFRGELAIEYVDGTKDVIATKAGEWLAGVAGRVTHADIFDGEEYDARQMDPVDGKGLKKELCDVTKEFKGEVLMTDGAEVTLRKDLAMAPIEAYTWKGVVGAAENVFGRVAKVREFKAGEAMVIEPGEKLVVDFGQNSAAVPYFKFRADEGVMFKVYPAEMLNDANGEKSRGNDGPAGSVYRANLRTPETGMRIYYTFGKGGAVAEYSPRFTFFGYRYLSMEATGKVVIEKVESWPVTSLAKDLETGTMEVGDASLNRFVKNVYWGQLSNYLSVPTDCPQRNERLGWSGDTQVFCAAGSYNMDTRKFFKKFTRDLRDSQGKDGGFTSVAPWGQYGNETFNFGWADVGVIVPWTVWRQFGDEEIVRSNWEAMAKFVQMQDATKYNYEGKNGYIYADWLSFQTYETHSNQFGNWTKWKDDPDARNYRCYLAACYWLYDARLMIEMGEAIGKDVAFFRASAARALDHIRTTYLEADGKLLKTMRDLQTACVFALKLDIVEGAAKESTKADLVASLKSFGNCLQTGFIGTSFLMDALSKEGEWDMAYTLLTQHKHPSWLYSVDQGATTIWERWNSYTKKDGFGPVGMNSFNHYAYGAVLAWMYRHTAGIQAAEPGFKKILMAPRPDRRVGSIKASYKSVHGLIKSAWRYEGEKWLWDFTIPEGTSAAVLLPDGSAAKTYKPGTYHVELVLK